MKRKRIIVTALLCSGLLISCGESSQTTKPPTTEVEPDKPDKPDPQPDPNPDKPDPEEPQKDDFVIKTESNAGSFDKESYTFTTINPKDDYYHFDDPILIVAINRADWKYVTAVNESKTKIISENEEVLPSTAVTYKLDGGDGIGINDIKNIKLQIDRTKVKKGTTKLKIHFEPSNGVNTASDLDLCVPIEIKEYGTIGSKIESFKFNVDLTGIDKKYVDNGVEFAIIDDDYVYGASNTKSQTYVLQSFTTTDLEVRLPVGNNLYFKVGYNGENNKWTNRALKLESDSSFDINGEYYVFKSAPTKALNVTLA